MITSLFPTLIHKLKVDDFPSIKDQLIQFVYEEKELWSSGNYVSNIGGWQSKPHYNSYDNILFNIIKQTVKIFDTLDIVSLWMNINGKGHHNTLHNHPHCDYAGCFYIQTFDDCGDIYFESQGWKEPEEGTIFLFPSSLQHKVGENKTDKNRISSSFNMQLKSEK
tara:strand:- start:481 stop:975 length:495 start_codon:yes stop_codon:yes gene_type:complete